MLCVLRDDKIAVATAAVVVRFARCGGTQTNLWWGMTMLGKKGRLAILLSSLPLVITHTRYSKGRRMSQATYKKPSHLARSTTRLALGV